MPGRHFIKVGTFGPWPYSVQTRGGVIDIAQRLNSRQSFVVAALFKALPDGVTAQLFLNVLMWGTATIPKASNRLTDSS